MRYHVNFLYRVADSFFRHRWLFLIAVLTTTGAAVVGLRFRSTTYKESALTRIVPNDTTVALGSNISDDKIRTELQKKIGNGVRVTLRGYQQTGGGAIRTVDALASSDIYWFRVID